MTDHTITKKIMLVPFSDTSAAIEAGRLLAERQDLAGVPSVVLPPDYRLELHPELLPTPTRTRRTVRMHEPEAFCAYVNRYAREDTLVLWDRRTGAFLAVIDYDGPDRPDWGEHLVRFDFCTTPEWDVWRMSDGKRMIQEDFALFVEQNTQEIVSPAAATMIEIASTLQAKKSVGFRSGVRLDNGAIELRYEEQIDGKAGHQGTLEIPQIIKLGMEVHHGGAAYEIEARFRYRITDRRLTLWYDLIRPYKVAESSVEDVAEFIANGLGDVQMYNGDIN